MYLNFIFEECHTEMTETCSRFNEAFLLHGINLAAKIRDNFPEITIAYLAFYQAQL